MLNQGTFTSRSNESKHSYNIKSFRSPTKFSTTNSRENSDTKNNKKKITLAMPELNERKKCYSCIKKMKPAIVVSKAKQYPHICRVMKKEESIDLLEISEENSVNAKQIQNLIARQSYIL